MKHKRTLSPYMAKKVKHDMINGIYPTTGKPIYETYGDCYNCSLYKICKHYDCIVDDRNYGRKFIGWFWE